MPFSLLGPRLTAKPVTIELAATRLHGDLVCPKQADIVRAFGVTTKSREAFREAVSREGACGVLCPTPGHKWAGASAVASSSEFSRSTRA
jgi:hypothetical protein